MGGEVHGRREGLGLNACIDAAAAEAGHVLYIRQSEQAVAVGVQRLRCGVFGVSDVCG